MKEGDGSRADEARDAQEGRIVPMRLQKFLARAGAASRRGSENLMTAGRVKVNGDVVTELGSKVDPRVDVIEVDGNVVNLADGPVTIVLHKPAGFVTTMSDPQGRPTVAQLVPLQQHPGLFPVGRLDRDTTGLLLFSTDGELGNCLLKPRGHVMKRYLALVEGDFGEGEARQLRRGIVLDDGATLPARVRALGMAEARRALRLFEGPGGSAESSKRNGFDRRASLAGRSIVEVEIHEGRKRQVRRMLEAVGHPVVGLHRDRIGSLALGSLPRGSWRELSSDEVARLHRDVEDAAAPCSFCDDARMDARDKGAKRRGIDR